MVGSDRARSLWPWLAVVLMAIMAAQPLWGLPPQGDDLLLHYFRIPLVNAQWAAGFPLARWQPHLVYGYGSPLFTFYPPLSAWLLTALYWLAGQQADVAINLLFALCLLLGAVGMFGAGRALAGEMAGLLATAVFTFSPHLAAQIYSRGSTSNSLALALAPLVVWLIWRVGQRPSAGRVAAGGLGVALLMLSHTAASLLLLAPLVMWGVVALAGLPAPGRRWLALLGLFGLGLALAAFAWLPALAEIQFTRYAAEAGKVNYADHFTLLWDWPGTAVAGMRNPYLPKTVGLAALLVGAGGTAVSAWSLWRWWRNGGAFPAREAAFFAAGLLGWGILFLTLPIADFVWRLLPPLRGLQFPWRLLDVPALFLPLAGLRLLARKGFGEGEPKGGFRFGKWALVGLILLSYVNLVPYLYPPRWADLPARPSLADVTAVQQKYQIIGLTAWGEYSDARVKVWPVPPPVIGETVAEKLQTAVPANGLRLQQSDPWTAVWQTSFSQPTTLTFASHIFPGWQARLDGSVLPVGADENGRLQVSVPAGEHSLTVQFGRTPVRWLADGLSLAGLLVCGWLLVRKPVGKKQPKPETSGQPSAAPLVIGIAVLLLVVKVAWLDRGNSPLVVQVEDGRIPGIISPAAGNFQNEVELIGVQTDSFDQLTLYWRALQPPTQPYRVALTLLDGRGVPVQTAINSTPGNTVMTNWAAGEIVRDAYTLDLPPDAPAGYTVQLALLPPTSENQLPLAAGSGGTTVAVARLKQPPPDTAVPPHATAIGTIFGDAILLDRAAVPESVRQGEPLDFVLYWEAKTAVAEDYTVFVHLLTPEGEFVSGQDGQPVGGLYPTSFWSKGELIADARSWLIEQPPGEYQLQVGLYLLATGARLPASGANSQLGDRVPLQTIQILP